MIAFLLVIYTGLVAVLFKLKIVKPRPYPILSILVIGVLLVGGIVAAWMLCAPLTPKVVLTEYVIPLVPYVKGQVRKVHAVANQPVKKGDLLLEIETAPYQYAVSQAEAAMEVGRQNINQAKAGLDVAQAGVLKAKDGVTQAAAALNQARAAVANAQASLRKAMAADELAKTEEAMATGLQKTDASAISVLKVKQAEQNRQAADAALGQAQAAVTQAEAGALQAEAGVSAANSSLAQAEATARQSAFTLKVAEGNLPGVQAQLDDARFNLTQCKVLAPADGYVVNWQVQEGTMLVPLPLSPAGTFMSTGETALVAAFPQNYLVNVMPGDEVEIVLDPYPGRLFRGKVDFVIPATGEGQYKTGGDIPMAARVGSVGVLAVRISLDPKERPATLPLGTGGTVAIYTNAGKPVHIISKVALRMKKWLLYVLPSVTKPS